MPRFRELISLSRKAIRNVRHSLEELSRQIAQQQQPQLRPALARVPLQNNQNPFRLPKGRGFATLSRVVNSRPLRPSLVLKMWQFSAFRFANQTGIPQFVSKGSFPGLLYGHFKQTNGRMYSSFRSVASDPVRSLLSKPLLATHRSQPHLGSMNANESYVTAVAEKELPPWEAPQENTGCLVEFNLKPTYTLPSMSFLDDETMATFKQDLSRYVERVNCIKDEVDLIKSQLGSLCMSCSNSVVRIHMPNCEVDDCESLLVDLGITSGVAKGLSTNASLDLDPVLSSSSSSQSLSSFVMI